MPGVPPRTLGDFKRLTPDLRGLGDARLVSVEDGPGRGQRLLLLRNAAGVGVEIAVDRGFDIAALTLGGINLGWNSPNTLPRPTFAHDLEDGMGVLRALDGFLVTCGLDNYGLAATGTATHLAYPVRQRVHYPLHGRIAGQPGRLIGYGLAEGERPVLWCEGEVRQTALFGEVLVLRRRIELDLFSTGIALHDTVTNAGFRPARHGILYHFNIGYPLLDEASCPTGSIGPLAEQWRDSPPVPDDDSEEQVDVIEPLVEPDGLAQAGLCNPSLLGGTALSIRFDPAQLPGLALWRCWQSGIFALGIEPNSALDATALDYEGPGTGPFLEAGESRRYDLAIELSR
jgi:hypothetical protein